MRTAIYPGSFDPVTLGHLNIIRRAATIFDQVVVCCMVNSAKMGWFSLEERVDMLERVTSRFPNVTVDSSNILIGEYAKRYKGPVLLKGLRAGSDFESEFSMAHINKKINPALDTVFLTSDEKYTFLSSSAVKELARYDADLTHFAPREILDDVREKSKKMR